MKSLLMIKIQILLFVSLLFVMSSCKEDDYGKNYDIHFPVSTIDSFAPSMAYVDSVVTLFGDSLSCVCLVQLSNVSCEIVSQNSNQLKFKVARSAESNPISLYNLYQRSYTSTKKLIVLYPDVNNVVWCSEIERGKVFVLNGENMDMIESAKIDGKILSKAGLATENKIAFSTEGVALGSTAVIILTTKTEQTIISSAIPVVDPV